MTSDNDTANLDILKIEDVAAYLQVSRRSVFRWMRAGLLPAVRIGGVTRVRRGDLESFIAAHVAAGPSKQAHSGKKRSVEHGN
jgi:excisionase family DNA binding protein